MVYYEAMIIIKCVSLAKYQASTLPNRLTCEGKKEVKASVKTSTNTGMNEIPVLERRF